MWLLIKKNKSALLVTYGCMLFEGAINVLMVATMMMLEAQYIQTAGAISMLITAKSIGTVVTIYFSGTLSDLIGRRRIIAIGAVLFMIFLVGMVITTEFWVAFMFAFIGGVAHGLMDSPSISMLIDIFGKKSGPAMSFVQVFFASGGAITSYITSLFILYGFDWKWIYFGYALLGFVVIAIVLCAKYPNRIKESDSDVRVQHNWKPSFRREGMMLATLTFVLASVGAILNTWLPTYANLEKNMSLVMSVQLLTKMQLGNIVGALVFAYILTKLHATVLLIFNPAVALVGIIAIIFLPEVSSLSVFVVGMMLGVLFSLSLNVAGDLFPESSGRATGFMGSASMASGMLTVFLSGKVYPLVGFNMIFQLSIVLLVIAIIIALLFRIDFKKLIKEDEHENDSANYRLRSRNG